MQKQINGMIVHTYKKCEIWILWFKPAWLITHTKTCWNHALN